MVCIEALATAPIEATFGTPKVYNSGSKFIAIEDPIVLTLPAMTAPFGVSSFGAETKLTVPLNVTSPEAQAGLAALDAWAKQSIQENSQEWLGRARVSDDVLELMYSPQLKAGRGNYPPTTKLSIKLDEDGEPFFGHDGINVGYKKGAYTRHQIKTLVEATGFWIAGGRIGLCMNLLKIKVAEPLAHAAPRVDVSTFLFDDEISVSA